jgi:hypothetical protein
MALSVLACRVTGRAPLKLQTPRASLLSLTKRRKHNTDSYWTIGGGRDGLPCPRPPGQRLISPSIRLRLCRASARFAFWRSRTR